ncbi:MAG: serine/threonine protein kinase [Planctomycetes bacterium]|nr:serine/threonine protein kinase [Planctomycetota bacterium]
MSERLKELFATAIDLPPGDRTQFVHSACSGDAPLRDRLLGLLRAHAAAGDFLEHPAALVEAAAGDADDERDDDDDDGLVPGQTVGAFTLVERIGRGGFGSVWRARQEQPVARDVALKVLHAGFDAARQTLRFLAECRTLARLQHASIAQVFEAGTAPSGRPWLAMELVDGVPITQHCDARRLGWRDRVQLVAATAAALQHAHQKGIVHRDLKPSNVLVALRDDRAHPVVIDFGVARELDADAADAADEPGLLGTIDYMSPEQAGAGRAGVDTRTDVHALGVLLYELVAGQRPFRRGSDELDARPLLRRIREQLPPPPTTVPGALPRLPRELDWITARALAKDPDARYQTAAALADDLRRLLAGEAVAAGPAHALYRARKFARRHWLPVALATALVLSSALGAIVAARGWSAANAAATAARAAERQARADQLAAERESRKANRALALLDELWQGADPTRFGRADYPVRELLADFERNLGPRSAGEPAVELRLRLTLGHIQRVLGDLDRAERHAERAVALARAEGDPAALVAPLLERARTAFDRGEPVQAEALATEALAIVEAAADGGDSAIAAQVLELLANCRHRLGDSAAALAAAERALQLRAIGAPIDQVRSQLQLANLHGAVGRVDVAMGFVQQALDELRGLGFDHPDLPVALQHLAFLQQRQGDHASAEASFRESLQRRREIYGDDHAQVAWAEADLGWLLHERGRHDEAATLLEQALATLRDRLGERHLYVSEAMQRLGAALAAAGRRGEAAALLGNAVTRFRTLPGHPADGLVGCLGNLAALQWQDGDREVARTTMTEAVQIARRELPHEHFIASVALTNLGTMLAELGETEAAIGLVEDALARSTAGGRDAEARLQRERLAQWRGRAAATPTDGNSDGR